MSAFEVWAPRASSVRVRVDGTDHPMTAGPHGWWRASVHAEPGATYGFVLDGADEVLPDPRGRWLPDGVHSPGRRYNDGAYAWQDSAWTGRALPGSVLYELHIGTFTPDGTFDAAIAKLDHLVELGVDLVELLPVNGFNGVHNWGYDGVAWYAVHEPYGGPDGLKRFVDACHRKGLGVLLDVVYNHLGPSGNYLPRFGPYLASGGRNTWGDLVNLDGPEAGPVRRFIVENALGWLRDFHIDGLRLDAVHALADDSATHLLEELAAETDALSAHVRRPLTLIAESDMNNPRLITPREAGGYGLTAQWDDDVHHALHALLTGERAGYYADFGALEGLATVLTGGFFHAGTYSSFRGRVHGRPVDVERTAGYRFVAFLQDHDQIGNRAAGDRIGGALSDGLLKVGAALLFTAPFTPMLFMGEEWAASTPWQFFTSHPEPELGRAVAEGRIAEFRHHEWDTAIEVPDPQDLATFHRSKLDWSEAAHGRHADLLDWHRRLIALRRREADLADPRLDRVRVSYDEEARWLVVHRGSCAVAVNLAAEPRELPVHAGEILLASADVTPGAGTLRLPAESVAIVRTS